MSHNPPKNPDRFSELGSDTPEVNVGSSGGASGTSSSPNVKFPKGKS